MKEPKPAILLMPERPFKLNQDGIPEAVRLSLKLGIKAEKRGDYCEIMTNRFRELLRVE